MKAARLLLRPCLCNFLAFFLSSPFLKQFSSVIIVCTNDVKKATNAHVGKWLVVMANSYFVLIT